MCLVEVQNAPKPVASCAMPVSKDMKIYTDTPLVKKARESVLEFLLINHPLDCPICDQGGECDLQEQTLAFGSDKSRFFYDKRGVEDKNCGPLIKTIMTRCIHCTRCVRFFQNVAGKEDLGTTARGKDTEIGTYVGKTLNSELSGNVIDLCPVGALTSKLYAFTARPWELKSAETIDVMDSVGSNIKVNFKETEILRVLPVLNDSLNEERISDKTRFSFDGLKNQRIGHPFLKKEGLLSKISWENALKVFTSKISTASKKKEPQILFVTGNQNDLETVGLMKNLAKMFSTSVIPESTCNVSMDFLSKSRLSTNFVDILDSDFCLLVGTNPRFEASLLNVRLKKRMNQGLFKVVSFGLSEDLTYTKVDGGVSVTSLIKFFEGRHPLCQQLTKAKKPMVILGSSVLKRVDGHALQNCLYYSQKHVPFFSEGWFGLNYMPTEPSGVGNSFLGVQSTFKEKNELKKIDFFFGVGLDHPQKFLRSLPEECFSVLQTAYSDPSLKKANMILPGVAFTEKVGQFLNLEGRLQKTEIALRKPGIAREDTGILRAITENGKIPFKKFEEVKVMPLEKNKESFLNILDSTTSSKKNRVMKTVFKGVVNDFFVTNAITKNSKIMAKCSSNFRKIYTNFQ
jgi:NADH-quinone oxidoreductase chain G